MPTTHDPVASYAHAVLAGEIVAGRLVRLACERHLRDLEHGTERGLRWCPEKAKAGLEIFNHIKLPEGDKPFVLSPWEEFIVGSLFGWFDSDGFRRFRTAYVEAGKGNGKTPLAAGIGLKGLVADGERSAEIYTAGVTRDQASYLLNDAVKLVEASPALRRRVEVNAHNLAVLRTNSFMRPVSSEARSLDQKRVHMALIDEIHEHPNSLVVDKMRAGTKGRRQALIFEITNSGYDRDSVCWHHHEYSRKVVEGLTEDDSWFAYVCQLDEGDDWTDEKVWIKANPNLGVSITLKYLREQVREAVGMPSKQNIVKRLNFCIWTEQETRWLDIARWDACNGEVRPENFEGAECFAAVDLASTTDIAALVLLFPTPGGYSVLPFFWVPEEACKRRERSNKDRIDQWVRAGLIEATSGDWIDYDVIHERIKELAKKYNIKEIAIDRWNSTQLATQLQGDGFNVLGFGQGYASMSAPTKELEKLILAGQIRHGGNPVLRWMAGNVACEQDAAGNVKPSKSRSKEKIDGIVSLIMALGRAISQAEEHSVYEKRGVLVI
ncbi:MAG TPA: terminase TerL endonuclease subunit [Gemmataceae bacterium]|nr:terminase TerL endonuclease subunit [Gemmataceae bacterium]